MREKMTKTRQHLIGFVFGEAQLRAKRTAGTVCGFRGVSSSCMGPQQVFGEKVGRGDVAEARQG